VALVTGGNSGIGLGMARALAEAGADVAIWGTNPAKNAAAKTELAKSGRRIVALECDVSDEAAVERAFAETLRQLGRVDACFANAGVSGRGGIKSFADMSAEITRAQVNLDAPSSPSASPLGMVERGRQRARRHGVAGRHEGAPRNDTAASKGRLISMIGRWRWNSRVSVRANILPAGSRPT
jgi:NAD(P)-dependent dehydrogenase (short-subunit alcohol dehydrogenase family)